MSINEGMEDARTRWARAGADSDIGLWWIADDIRQLNPGASEEEIRRETLRALRPLLSQGLLRAVNLFPGGVYQPWDGSVEEQLARIGLEWALLGRPPDIGDIVWFIGPERRVPGRPSSR
jgi:glycine/D-amino acid oxidase-like deaminating enzyme